MKVFEKVRSGVVSVGRGMKAAVQKTGVVAHSLVVAGAALLFSSPAMAQGAPTMDAITLPIDGASIVTAIVALGAAVLILTYGPSIGFRMVHAVFRRVTGAV